MIAKKTMESQLLLQYPDYEENIKQAKPSGILENYNTSRDASELNQHIGPYNRGTSRLSEDDDRELEVVERYTKVKTPMMRVYDPYEPREHIFTEEQFKVYLQQPAFILRRRTMDPIYLTSKEVTLDLLKVCRNI